MGTSRALSRGMSMAAVSVVTSRGGVTVTSAEASGRVPAPSSVQAQRRIVQSPEIAVRTGEAIGLTYHGSGPRVKRVANE